MEDVADTLCSCPAKLLAYREEESHCLSADAEGTWWYWCHRARDSPDVPAGRRLAASSLLGKHISSLTPDPAESIPTMLDSFQSREVKAGRPVELPCIASGYPNPAVRWIKDGRPLPSDSRWTKRITGLTISDLRVEDSGTYICEVTNTFGSAEVTGTLTVIGESPHGGAGHGGGEASVLLPASA